MNYKPSIDFFKETRFIQLVLIIVAVALIWFLKWSFNPDTPLAGPLGEASVILNIKNEERIFKGETTEGMTNLDALSAAAEAGKVNFLYELDKNNLVKFVVISDYKTPDTPFSFLLNDQEVNFKELNKTNIKAGDVLKIKI